MCYNEKNNSIVPVVELDTIKASDAFGPGSSPGGHTKKDGFYPSFFMRVSRRAKLNRGDPFGVSVDAEGCGFARREEECLPQNHSDEAAHEALCRSIPSQKTKPVFVIFHFTMSQKKLYATAAYTICDFE